MEVIEQNGRARIYYCKGETTIDHPVISHLVELSHRGRKVSLRGQPYDPLRMADMFEGEGIPLELYEALAKKATSKRNLKR
jgi:hypothetical protein